MRKKRRRLDPPSFLRDYGGQASIEEVIRSIMPAAGQ